MKGYRSFAGTLAERYMRRVLRNFLRPVARPGCDEVCGHLCVVELLMPLMRIAELDMWPHLWFRGFCPVCRVGFTCDLLLQLPVWHITFEDEKASGERVWFYTRGARFTFAEIVQRRRRRRRVPAWAA